MRKSRRSQNNHWIPLNRVDSFTPAVYSHAPPAIAQELIAKMGYGRRKPEAEELSKALQVLQ